MKYFSFFLLITQLTFVIEVLSEDLKEYNNKSLKWEIIERNNNSNKKNNLEWKIQRNVEDLLEIINQFNKVNSKTIQKANYDKLQRNEVFEISPIVPLNNFIEKNNIRSKIEWKSSFGGGAAGGTGQQNNSFIIDYGIGEFSQLTGYFSEADDDTYRYINGNRAQYFMQTYALSLKNKIWKSEKLKSSISFFSSIEYLRISSGSEKTKSIYNESNDLFGKDKFGKLIYSFSLPYTKKLRERITYSFVPGMIFLPEKIGSKTSRNNFYGNNFYIANGICFNLSEDLILHGSLTHPLGPGNNHFDRNLNFSRKPIYSYGINWDINKKIGIEAKITNGFGSTPATGLLTLPSENVLLYAANIKYRADGKDTPLKPLNKRDKLISYGGITVNNALLPSGQKNHFSINADSKGNYFGTYSYSLSNIFQLEILNLGSIYNEKNNLHKAKNFTNAYLDKDNFNIRVGGKFLLFSPQKNDILWTSFRTSLGRNESSDQGYILSELLNTYRINNWIASNLSLKYFLSGYQKFGVIGASMYLNVSDKLQIIPELNYLSDKNLNTNYTLAIRYSLNENKSIDLYSSNTLGTQDLGQLLKSKDNRIGIKLNFLY